MPVNCKFVCSCKCVTKREILNAIRKKGATSFADVRVITLATLGCGRCRPAVTRIVEDELKRNRSINRQLRIDFDEKNS